MRGLTGLNLLYKLTVINQPSGVELCENQQMLDKHNFSNKICINENHILSGAMSVTFETRIAAAAIAQDPNLIRQEFSRVLHISAEQDGPMRHRLGFRQVLYFKLKGSLEDQGLQLSPDDRRSLYQVLLSRSGQSGQWIRLGRKLERKGAVPLSLDMGNIVRITSRALRAHRGEALLTEQRSDVCSGEPVFKDTRIPVAQIVEQLRSGVSLSEITEDYPQLSNAALAYAQMQSRLGKAPGRPARALKIKRSAA